VRALDPRLLQYARATRTFLFLSIALGSLRALLIVAQAWLLVDVVVGAFSHDDDLAQLRSPTILLLCVVLARALVAWAAELAAGRSSAQAKSQLRHVLLERVSVLGLDSSRTQSTGELTVLATRGLDALDGYFSLYLPQLLLAVIVPLVVIVAVVSQDWISAAIIAFTIPLIPLFMALVGAATREKMDRQMRTLQRLAGHFLDVVAGLPTLKLFGRAKAQAASIHAISERYRETALSNLRVTFLSSLILELVATISVALVAVAIGLRLMGGDMSLRAGLFALVLAPEAYLPLRQLGANYHASAEGMAAAGQVFAVLADAQPPAPNPTRAKTGRLETRQLETPQLETRQLETPQLETPQLETPQLGTGRLGTGRLGTVSAGAHADTARVEPALTNPAGVVSLKNGVHENTGKFGNKVFETPSTPNPASDIATSNHLDTDLASHTATSNHLDTDLASHTATSNHLDTDLAGDGATSIRRGSRQEVPDMTAADITIEGLTVSYPGRLQPALDSLCLHVEAGEVVALAGPSGCGKSTLIGVLLGFVAHEQGNVSVGGVKLSEIEPDAWRAQLAWVPQRPHLFARSIAENVQLGRRGASDEELAAAIAAAGLSDVVAGLPDGLDTVLGERGAGLSAGERQRVALARAFLRDAPLLLLDEPTANLDGQTEQQVLEAVQRLSTGRTVILVAHRPALLEMADRVVDLGKPPTSMAVANRVGALDTAEVPA
jgi:ABC-type transport system involved in cytochrome bd biosynthesis fused ATPase/permease subunit